MNSTKETAVKVSAGCTAQYRPREVCNAVVENNLGLVHLCANRFRGKGIEYEELYSAGCIGLIKASRAFDEGRGVCFSTYAVPVILGEIKRLFRDGGTVKVSRGLKELSLKTVRTSEAFVKRNGREPTISELAGILGEDEQNISQALAVSLPPLSLTCGDDDGGGQTDIPSPSPDTEIGDLIALRQIMSLLEDEDRLLLTLRYFRGYTQCRVAAELGITQVQVSRREKKLLLRMREKLLE